MPQLSNSKVLKILREAQPDVKWMRRSKSDNEKDGTFFAGVIGKEGIQFTLVRNYNPALLRETANAVARRLRETRD